MLYILVLLVIIFYLYGVRTFGYWKKRGIKNDHPLPYFGNNFKQFFQKSSYAMTATEMYKKYPEEKVVGFFRSTAPELVIRDPDLAKRILVTDFQHFYARGFNTHKTVIEPLLKNLFFADGDLWRLIRKRFGSAFSTGKIKAMFHIIAERAEKLQLLAEEVEYLEHYDVRELMARYTTDFIGACGFGINMDSLNNENSEFRRLGKRIFHRTPRDAAAAALKFIFPELCKNIHFLAPDLEESVCALVKQILQARNYSPCGNNDFIDLMLELKKEGNISVESLEQKDENGRAKQVELKLDDLLLTAQIFLFFGAGFETSSTSSSFTLHQLAFNSDHQKKVQEEIDRVLLKHDNKITYDAVNEMHYLEKSFYEAMRMYPPVGFLMRQCTTPKYTFPEIGLTIDEGVKVIIPIQAFHRDEKYFHDPNVYNPDRFTSAQDMKTNYFLPFGDGPRACIAARLGKLLAMAGIAAILQKFSVEPCEKSKLEPIPDPMAIVSEGFIGGLPLKLRKRELIGTLN
ncbi:cytochrome P450 6B7-like [Maniola jurtina]|uniref:cytochrome P450 6B7-like n=1 Tax=Maniola jurtina TaxID=191418 RepID=UPI001E68AB9F|nr:cytochrome P450 6B7-like [Maniola jurtina]